MTAASYFIDGEVLAHAHSAPALAVSLAVVCSLAPVVLAIVVIARYLSAEQDEFVRALVIGALLWGFGITMVAGDAVAGVLLQNGSPGPVPLALLNADLLFVSSGISLRLLNRSYNQ